MYPQHRIIFQIDGRQVAVMSLCWDPQKCYDCGGHHYELMTGRGYLVLSDWHYVILPSNFGDA